MKIISTLLFFVASIVNLQAQRDISPAITDALSRGDAMSVSSFFNENVELVIGSTNDVFSKKQATGILADFFKKNKVSSFQILHKGSKENSAFSICTLRAGTTNFRVYVLVRRTADEQQLIQQLRIESTND
jgi:hypothetical protein